MQSLLVPDPPPGSPEPDGPGVLSAWYAEDGEEVEEGQLVAEVDYGSLVLQVTASRWGLVRKVIPVGDEVQPGDEVGALDD